MSDVRGVDRRPSREDAEGNFHGWLVSMADDLSAHVDTYLPGLEPERCYTVGSLAEAERALLAHLDDRRCFVGTMRYLGETLLRSAGGRWEWEELWETGAPGAGLPFVRVDGPEGRLTGGTVNLFQACSIAGGNRTGTVLPQLVTAVVEAFGARGPLRRCSEVTTFVDGTPDDNPAMAQFLATHEQELAAFVAEHSTPEAPLDGSPESLDRLEEIVVHRYPDHDAVLADWDSTFVRGASRYLGQVLLDSAPGRWMVADPSWFDRPLTDFERTPAVQRVFANEQVGGRNKMITSLRRSVGSSAEIKAERRRDGINGVLRRVHGRYVAEEP